MATNTQALCTQFKLNVLQSSYNFGTASVRPTGAADTFKAALYFVNSSLGAATTVYTASGEVTGTGYVAGGITVTNATAPNSSGTTAFWTPSANLTWSGLTISSSFDACLIYNSTQSNQGFCVLTFPAQTISAGTFTITMPANTATTALLQVN